MKDNRENQDKASQGQVKFLIPKELYNLYTAFQNQVAQGNPDFQRIAEQIDSLITPVERLIQHDLEELEKQFLNSDLDQKTKNMLNKQSTLLLIISDLTSTEEQDRCQEDINELKSQLSGYAKDYAPDISVHLLQILYHQMLGKDKKAAAIYGEGVKLFPNDKRLASYSEFLPGLKGAPEVPQVKADEAKRPTKNQRKKLARKLAEEKEQQTQTSNPSSSDGAQLPKDARPLMKDIFALTPTPVSKQDPVIAEIKDQTGEKEQDGNYTPNSFI